TWALLALGNQSEAKTSVARGLAIARTRDLLLQSALIQRNAGNHAAARATLGELLIQHPEDIGALEELMITYAGQKQLPAGIARLRQMAAERPQSVELQLFLGGWLQKTGKSGEARAAFEAAQKAHSGVDAAEFAL